MCNHKHQRFPVLFVSTVDECPCSLSLSETPSISVSDTPSATLQAMQRVYTGTSYYPWAYKAKIKQPICSFFSFLCVLRCTNSCSLKCFLKMQIIQGIYKQFSGNLIFLSGIQCVGIILVWYVDQIIVYLATNYNDEGGVSNRKS